MDFDYREMDSVKHGSTDPASYQRVRSPIAGMAKDYPHRTEIPSHSHVRAQLIYASRGAVRVRTPAGTWIVPPNSAVWVPPHVEHAVTALGAVAMRTLYVVASLAKRRLPAEPVAVAVSPLLRELILRALEVPLDRDPDANGRRIFGLIVDELRACTPLPLLLPVADAAFAPICESLLDDAARLPTIAEAARRMHVSSKTFSRHFFAATGMTFGAWCRRARLLHALARLGTGDAVTSVALDLGYASPSAFTAMFRRTLGAPPTHYLRAR